MIYKRYPKVYVKIVILKGNCEKGSPFVSVNELHTVGLSFGLYWNTEFLPIITEQKQAIKRPAKYIIPLISWFKIDDNVKKLTRINGDNLYAV